MTLNEIAYNIKNIVEGGATTLDSNISIRHIEAMIHYHRAQLLLKYTDGGRYISSSMITVVPSNIYGIGVFTIPPVLGFANNRAIVSMEYHSGGEVIQLPLCYGPDKDFFFESRFGPSDERIIAVIGETLDTGNNRSIYLYSGINESVPDGYVYSRLVLSQPEQDMNATTPDPYPIPEELISTLVETILKKEFNVILSVGKDYTNNSVDDNMPGAAAANIKASAQPSATARSRKARTR